MSTTAVFLGVTDEQESCDCCGKTNLKRTVRLRFDDDTEEVHYGTTCAARTLGLTNTQVTNAAVNAQTLADRMAVRRLDIQRRYTAALETFWAAREARRASHDEIAREIETGSPTLAAARGDFNRRIPFDDRNGVERYGCNFPQYLSHAATTGSFPEVIA